MNCNAFFFFLFLLLHCTFHLLQSSYQWCSLSQKYRLHTRRSTTPAVQSSGASSPQQPQIVLVGGIWMPPPEFTAAAAAAQPAVDTTGAPSNRVYAPVASLPSELGSQQLQQQSRQKSKRSPTGPLNSEGRRKGDDNSEDAERTNSDSSATSSSSQTTTASHPFWACEYREKSVSSQIGFFLFPCSERAPSWPHPLVMWKVIKESEHICIQTSMRARTTTVGLYLSCC